MGYESSLGAARRLKLIHSTTRDLTIRHALTCALGHGPAPGTPSMMPDRSGIASVIDTPAFSYTLRDTADPTLMAEAGFGTRQVDDISLVRGSWFPTDGLWEMLATPDLVRSALGAAAAQSRVLAAIRDAHHAGAIVLPHELLTAIDGALACAAGASHLPAAIAN